MSPPKILLVDDDAAVRSSIAFALGVEGFDIGAFDSAEAVLESAAAQDCACMVVDHHLPGMDGLALLRSLRGRGIGSPAIVITSNPSRQLRQRVAEAGAQLVEKPLLCDALAATIRTITGRPAKAGR